MTRFYKLLAALGLTFAFTLVATGCSWDTEPDDTEEEYEEPAGEPEDMDEIE